MYLRIHVLIFYFIGNLGNVVFCKEKSISARDIFLITENDKICTINGYVKFSEGEFLIEDSEVQFLFEKAEI